MTPIAIVDMQNSENSPASLQRRLAALVYDGLLLFAVAMLAGFIIVPFTSTVEVAEQGAEQNIFNPFMLAYYLAVFYLFFTWFWTHGGQTLGMRAWHTRLVTENGQALNWKHSLFRYLISLPLWFFWIIVIGKSTQGFVMPVLDQIPNWVLFAIATCWLLIDHLPNNWRDRFSRTYIVYIPKQ